MRKFLDRSLVFCLGIFLTSASVRGDDETPERGRRETAAKKDIESLQGVWTAVSLKALGKQLPEKGVKKLAIRAVLSGIAYEYNTNGLIGGSHFQEVGYAS